MAATGANAGARVPVSGSDGGFVHQWSACTAGVAFETLLKTDGACVITLTKASGSGGYGEVAVFQSNAADIKFGIAACGDGVTRVGTLTNHHVAIRANNVDMLHVRAGGIIGINASSNSKMTTGLTVHQGAATNEILALKSSTVTHGITDETETDTYALFTPYNSTQGGVRLEGLSETGIGLSLEGTVTTGCSTRSTAAICPVNIKAFQKSGTAITFMPNNENLVGISNGVGTIRFIFDADGDLSADAAVTASAYDAYDDALLVRLLDVERAPRDVVRTEFDRWLKYNRGDLERLKIATFNNHPGGDGSIFVNYMGLARLHSGAIWQEYTERHKLEARLSHLTNLLEIRTGSPFTDNPSLESP